jgi:hypothetical protein
LRPHLLQIPLRVPFSLAFESGTLLLHHEHLVAAAHAFGGQRGRGNGKGRGGGGLTRFGEEEVA